MPPVAGDVEVGFDYQIFGRNYQAGETDGAHFTGKAFDPPALH